MPLLLGEGHTVTGTTRSKDKADGLKAGGVEPVVVDVFDAPPCWTLSSARGRR